ncbi:biotin/lipoyl-containing protein [Actinomadura sp. 6K520]|uniref:acetyl-CoA carboxylase biotin carboxyl carrier protein n=1 Tax=Actinomadura sp. 6K520 TaxID=2530364 RepID=UPI0010457303|nr:biotin/lipoyl-containing protein [Actinomadura sp. 6K520]TDE25300.1 acetyl-CoA carboxylase, biotin carboxyl carrier protein [Actinomadura sp. 6K520]
MTSEQAERNDVLDDVCDHAARLISAADPRLHRLSIRTGDIAVELEWSPAAAPAPEPPGALAAPAQQGLAQQGTAQPGPAEPEPCAATGQDSLHYVCAEMVGTFYSAPEPGAEPFVTVGDEVRAGQQIAILEVMKLMTPVGADRAGRVAEVLVPDGTSVEYGTGLIALDTSVHALGTPG